MSDYISVGKTTNIKATSRIALKVKDNYVTCEYSEEVMFPEGSEPDMDKERQLLYKKVNDTLSEHIVDTVSLLNN